MSAPVSGNTPNLTRHAGAIPRADRFRALNSPGATIWFTGLSASGKSTIACALERSLVSHGRFCSWLDGDNIRLGLCSDLGFSDADRHENIRRIGEVARLFADSGVIAITSFISPYRADRDRCRAAHANAPGGPLPFLEVFVDTPIALCEQRDPKGLYKKARAGQLLHFTGIDDPYEPPPSPDLVLPTATMRVDECVAACLKLLAGRGLISHG
jgi:adenylyl-sulfate kinase